MTNPDTSEADVDDSTQTKTCTKCGETKPLDSFNLAKKGRLGRTSHCRTCVNAYGKVYAAARRAPTVAFPDGHKLCRTCGKILPFAEFNKRSDRAGGLTSRCKPCGREQSRAWHQKNKERKSEYSRQWRKDNPERAAAKDKAWREANPDRRAANRLAFLRSNPDYFLKWSRGHREQTAEYAKRYRLANQELVIERNARRRAVVRAGVAEGPVDLESLWTGTCGICGKPMDREVAWPDIASKSLDHIVPVSKGGAHAQANLQWAHLGCNISKSNKLPTDL